MTEWVPNNQKDHDSGHPSGYDCHGYALSSSEACSRKYISPRTQQDFALTMKEMSELLLVIFDDYEEELNRRIEAEKKLRRYESAINRLTGGKPGYHRITVKELLTAIGDEDE